MLVVEYVLYISSSVEGYFIYACLPISSRICLHFCCYFYIYDFVVIGEVSLTNLYIAQLAGSVEYTNCIFAGE